MFFLVWGITFRFHGNAFAGIADGSKEAIRDRFSNAEILMHGQNDPQAYGRTPCFLETRSTNQRQPRRLQQNAKSN